MTDRNEIAKRAFRQGIEASKNTHVNGFEPGPMVEGGGRRPYRVGVIVVSTGVVHADFAMGLANFAARPGALLAIINQKFDPSDGSPIIALNNAIEISKAMQLDALFFVGANIVIPHDALRRLLRHDKDVVGATFLRAMEPHGLVVKTINDAPVDQEHGIAEVEVLPAGCLLVRTAVLDKVKRPHFRPVITEETETTPPGIAPEFFGFCQAVRAAGFQVFCDLDLSGEVVHVGEVGYRLDQALEQAAAQRQLEEAIQNAETEVAANAAGNGTTG